MDRCSRSVVALAFLLLSAAAAEPARAPVELTSPVQDKNFYLLAVLARLPAVRQDTALAGITAARLAALDNAAKTCATDLDCNTGAFRWTDDQAAEAGRVLAALYGSSPVLRTLTDGELRQSGMYARYNALPGDQFLERAWGDCVRGMNHAIDVYGLGKPPRYAAIDSMTYDATAEFWHRIVQNLVAVMEDDRARLDTFFAPSLKFAMELMLLNHRDEAGRLEPMEAGENAAAYRRIRTIDWKRYPYTVIVVPGSGNEIPGVSLSPGGWLRDELAAKQFQEGKAPFILVSGGYVHPVRTEYAEALEMKRDLMTRLGVPADAILIDPHARHTTTNLRNAARLMYRYGIPFDQKALITTDLGQSRSIESPQFDKRCRDELGYVPFKLLGRVTRFDLEFLPLVESLHIDPQDPLDP